jgi:hypothetical protein
MLPIYGPIKDRKGYGICGEGSQLGDNDRGELETDGEGEWEIRLTDYYWKPTPKKCSIA